MNAKRAFADRAVAVLTCAAFLASMAPLAAAGAPRGKRPPPAETPKGTLVIACEVEGATWEIDEGSASARSGTTPQSEPIPLEPGPHTIRVSKEGHLPFSDVFDIAAGQATEVEVDLVLYSGRLRVTATPEAVEVEVDGKRLGLAPQTMELSIGEHVVRLSKPGYVEEVRRASIRTGHVTDLSVKLMPLVEAQRRAGGGPIYKKWWFWSVAAVVVAGVVVPTVLLTRPKSESCCTPDWVVSAP
ncbi:MAG: PEGA domain-containing protein [Deltaproteobacteria bacterium]|nr:PEGA domain-containing protein [Deltaproteobacteria bacterium]